jgi:2-succinyl-5-enolpyruvyl-6-hydroxy-3-cyclohexene-1-carboxylate synthase
VHLNLPFREPLIPTGAALVDAPGRAGGRPWTVSVPATRAPDPREIEQLAAEVREHPNGLLVAGWGADVRPETAARFAAAAGWPVLADAISGLRNGATAVSAYEALLRADGFAAANRPEFVVRIGAPLTSKVATSWLAADVAQVLVDPDGAWLDPHHGASRRVAAEAELVLGALADALGNGRATSPWLAAWLDAESRARAAVDEVLDGSADAFEGKVARDVAAALPDGATLVVGSSVPVRALEWCMGPRTGLRVVANRGANGIDGFVSTVAGVSGARSPAPTVGLCGDLCFLHDTNGLLGSSGPATFVVLDNDGGGIFSYLPPADLPEFEELFATPHGLDLVEIARAHGSTATRVEDAADLPDAIASGAFRVLVVPMDRAKSVERHRAIWEAVEQAVRAERR